MPGLIVDFPRHLQNSDITSDINRASNINRVKKRVDFSPMSELCYFEREVNDLDKREIWYTKTELKDFRADNKRAVYEFQLRSIALSSSQQDSARDHTPVLLQELPTTGIENVLTPKLVKKSKLRRVCCWNAVLGEQERQYSYGEYDPVKLAKQSTYYSSCSAERAAI